MSRSIGVFAAIALLYCLSASAALQYPPHAEATRSVTVVRVVWMDPEEVDQKCAEGSPPRPPNEVYLGCYDPNTSTIYAPQPRSFNDLYRLVILGHEFWHALGAMHP